MTSVVIRAGELDRRVVLQQRSSSKDTYGQQVMTWTDVATLWANIRPLSGREMLTAGAINSELSHVVTIRYRSGVTPAMRLTYGGQVFNILSVIDPEMAHVSLELQCSVGLNQG